jgi:putative hydrolase of the HAD superfamily
MGASIRAAGGADGAHDKLDKVIRTVILDLGRVLVPFDFDRGYRAFSELSGLPPEEVRSRLSQSRLVHTFERGEIDSNAFHREVNALMGSRIPAGRFAEIWNSVFLPHTLLPESMVAAIRRRYRTVLLSNTNPMHYTMLAASYPILAHFDAYVLSYEVGAEKPMDLIYQRAIEAAQCAPGECFFTDDIPPYVEAARSHGIDAVLFEGREKLETELRARGVTWDSE